MRKKATLVIAACGAILLGGCAKKGDPFVPAYRVYIETYNADDELTETEVDEYDVSGIILSRKGKYIESGEKYKTKFKYEQTDEGLVQKIYYDGELGETDLLNEDGYVLRREYADNGQVTSFNYDEHNNLLSIDFPEGRSTAKGEYEYDQDGKVLTGKLIYDEDEPDDYDLTVYSYGDDGKLTKQEWYSANKTPVGDEDLPQSEMVTTFNANGDPVSELNKYRTADTGEIDTHELRYEYNEDGKCIRQETYDNDVLTEYVVMEYHYF